MTSERTRTVSFSSEVYSLDAVKRAAYQFAKSVVIDITMAQDQIVCSLRALKDEDLQQIEDRFRAEVLDYDIRINLAKETEPLRNLILSLAFSKTGLQG